MLVLRLLAVSCLIIALARPQTRNDEELKMGEGIDIVLCLDVSGSMSAQDLLPNRLRRVKRWRLILLTCDPRTVLGW
ncbi:hypothetical protein [Paraflavitalea speifideaquila]|uniref:hypothetical protein n=1 Tax=Paraflavitalea speifideaquila TaxID=3076558 RepID=UPI0028E7ED69|nr:hypothetical protein [Paraflavitalea speifideiaquila]